MKSKQLLKGGLLAGLVFYGVSFIQMLLTPGFDISKHPVSMLSLGSLGWIQITNFLVTGLLLVACAIGVRQSLRRQKAGTWGPILIAISGLGFMLAGIFTADPAYGFPAGAPEGIPEVMSSHASLHFTSFMLAFTALTAAAFVFARRFRAEKQTGLWQYSVVTGIAIPGIIIVSMVTPTAIGGLLATVNGIMTFIWLAIVSRHLRSLNIAK